MRAGAGTFLSVGVLETSDGSLRLGDMEPTGALTLPAGAVPVAGDLAARWGWIDPSEDFRSLMTSPRFDAAAELAVRMWQAKGRPAVDGVLALDPFTLRALLAGTGPISVDGKEFNVDNVVDEMLRGQYERLGAEADKDTRHQELGRIARAAFDAFNGGGFSTAPLAQALADAAGDRHLLAWSAVPAQEGGWKAAGVDGGLRSNSLLLGLVSTGGNKLDPYISVDATLTLRGDGDDTDGELRVRLENTAPEGQPQYLAGPAQGTGLAAGEYRAVLAVTLPGSTREARIEGVDQLPVAGNDGPTVVVGRVIQLPRGQHHESVVRFRLLGPHGMIRLEPSARAPAPHWRYRGQTWEEDGGRTVEF
jgi:hypothetical protein